MLEATLRGYITRVHLARALFGRPLYTVEAYLVDGLLIDSGPPVTASEMIVWCRGRDIQQVVNTHHHEDHAGGDSVLQRAFGVPIAAPEKALAALSGFPRLQFYSRLVWGQPGDVEVEPLGDVVETPHHCLRVVSTPGHSPRSHLLLRATAGLALQRRSIHLRTGALSERGRRCPRDLGLAAARAGATAPAADLLPRRLRRGSLRRH